MLKRLHVRLVAWTTLFLLAAAGTSQAQINIKLPKSIGGVKIGKPKIGVPKIGKPKIGIPKLPGGIDPRKKFQEAQRAAIRKLRKLSPQELFNNTARALSQRVNDELRKNQIPFNRKTGVADLRRTRMGRSLNSWIGKFAQGNKGSGSVTQFSFNVKSRKLVVRVHVQHKHNWGRLYPGGPRVDLYSVTQKGMFEYNFRRNSGGFEIDPGKLGPRINQRTIKKLQEGDLVAVATTMGPRVISDVVNFERTNQYSSTVAAWQKRYGRGNVYFSSYTFVKAAAPDQKLGKYVVNGVISGGSAVYPQIMADLREMARKESPLVVKWLQRKGLSNAVSIARELLAGKRPSSPYLKFAITTVRFSAREKSLGVKTPWRHVNHLAFAIVWVNRKTSGNSSSSSSSNSGSNSSTKPSTTPQTSVVITNATKSSVRYRLRRGGNWRTYVVEPGKGFRHASKKGETTFGIQFDGKPDKGVDLKTYRLNGGNKYVFRIRNGKRNIYKR